MQAFHQATAHSAAYELHEYALTPTIRTVRVIDVDLLAYNEREIQEPDLVLPHRRMHERAFVLVPLTELDPDPVLGGGRRLSTLRLGPTAVGGVRPFAPSLPVPG
jgi:7,8-dihydro-6-hydroxymethylpterin-pyrophosphokinase